MTALSPWEVATLLRDCTLNAVVHTAPWEIARVCVVPGEIAWDDCQCGQIAVAELRRYPSMSFPAEEVNSEDDCGMPWIVVVYTVSLARCAPMPDQNGNPPECSAMETAAQQLMDDMLKMQRGIQCCLDTAYNTHTIAAWQIGAQEISGPAGACIETNMQVLVGFTNECGC